MEALTTPITSLADSSALTKLANQYGTPLYVYSADQFLANWQAFNTAISHRPGHICYAVKANSNLSILKLIADQKGHFDIVSGGELMRVLRAGGLAEHTVFSGVAKQVWEIDLALNSGIGCFNVESEAELKRIESRAQTLGKIAYIAIRINPNINPNTHPYISTGFKENKFGIESKQAKQLYQYAHQSAALSIKGISCHIGSQLLDPKPQQESAEKLLQLTAELEQMNIFIEHIDLGGGLGVTYENEKPPHINDYVRGIIDIIPEKYQIVLEPGRSIAANSGVLLTRVEYLKKTADKHFALVDAAMNDLIRPALYGAYHHISVISEAAKQAQTFDVVGPVCESTDFFGKDRELPIGENSILCIHSAGAYCMGMASNYNARPLAAEVLLTGDQHRLVRQRQTFDDMLQSELQGLDNTPML